jgi:hypothetical protein
LKKELGFRESEHTAPEWQAAMEVLILVAEKNGPDDVRPHRRHAGVEPTRLASVQFRTKRSSLGKAEAGAGPVNKMRARWMVGLS